jgi:hypothetical protein
MLEQRVCHGCRYGAHHINNKCNNRLIGEISRGVKGVKSDKIVLSKYKFEEFLSIMFSPPLALAGGEGEGFVSVSMGKYWPIMTICN